MAALGSALIHGTGRCLDGLVADQLRKTYAGTEVVAGLSFVVQPGTCFGLLGPNGAGKTTTLRLCLGLTAPDSGAVSLNGLAIPADAQQARARVGVVPQFDNLDPDFTASENLLVFGRYFGIPDAEIKERIPQLLEFASLASKADARISTLSGGMKRRLTLARALVNNPGHYFSRRADYRPRSASPPPDLGSPEATQVSR
jgi:lipooligosaccharide transport system ATP-binding protein